MYIELFLKQHLVLYYFIIMFAIIISALLNKSKEKRIYQTSVAKYYLIITVMSIMLIFASKALRDFWGDSDLIDLIIIFGDKENGITQIVLFFAMVIGIIIKTVQKLKERHTERRTTTGTIKVDMFPPYSEIIDTADSKKKSNFLKKWFYDEEENVKDIGILFYKISKSIAIGLIVVYITMPIFWYYNMEMLYSNYEMLLLIITFMELAYSLQGEKKKELKNANLKLNKDGGIIEIGLKNLLKLSETEKLNLNEKMVGKKDIILKSPSALICEVPNSEELKEINIKVMNGAFFENKKVLVVCLNDKNAKEYHSKLGVFNEEYDGKLILKLITENDKLFDSSVDIYVTAIENCFGNIKLLSEIDTIIIEDYDEILFNKLELIRALGSIVRMGNSKIDYVILAYMIQGIEATIKSLLFASEISCYYKENKQQPKVIALNVWEGNSELITERVFGKATKNIGALVALSLTSAKLNPDRILFVSDKEPIEFELNELNAVRNLYQRNIENGELEVLSDKSVISTNGKYFGFCKCNWIIADDKNNLYEKIYKLSLINGESNQLNIVSQQYMLRDYMIDTYKVNSRRLKAFLPYVPYEVNSGKVVLYNLLLQLTNFGVKENIIANIFNESGIKIKLGKGNNVRFIADKLNNFIKQEFNVDIDIYSYINIQEVNGKYTFDITKKKYVEEERIYMLDEQVLKLFPDEIFKRVNFVKDGFALDIEKEYAYNFYQKYLPGQKHFFDGYIYEIKSVIENEDEVNVILETCMDYENNEYRQNRKVELISDFIVSETKTNKYINVISKYHIGKVDYKVKTEGYYEFKNGVSKMPGQYRYIELDDNNVAKTTRSHQNAEAIKLEILRLNSIMVKEGRNEIQNEELGQRIAFLISELLFSILGENANYVQVKSTRKKRDDAITMETWVSPIEKVEVLGDSIEIYILEDTKIERGLIDMIYKNLDSILSLLCEYLEWVFNPNSGSNKLDPKGFIRHIEMDESKLGQYEKILSILNNSSM